MKFFLFIAFILGFTVAQGQEVREFPMGKSSLLWKISGPNVESDSYLFGTMHLIEKEYFLFPKKLEKLVLKTDQLVMEIAGLPDQMEAMKYVMLEEGSFFDFFNQEQTDTILIWAKEKFSMEEPAFRAAFSRMKPFVIVQMATQMQFIGKTESYEMTFDKIAKEQNIEMKGLETIAQQMSFFDDLTNEQQVEMVMAGIRDADDAIKTITDMQKTYVTQDVDALYQMISDDGGVISEEQAKFLDNRNSNWIPQIVELIKTKNTFIAVGAGHLGGPNGVIRLLEKEGYTLTPIKL